eukprot:CAMPEP_0173389746 /NCGR_PEP_ID=MMETSP1356-20130122/13333_1 /TAXON_ID=77927 ORGANISM="Hemiselmis virescens, Strain PCC157" /NCGR_SAMPLE_ID=MMETSP1356 /ASSEMBLY_ACC=CAM_ASM_000847 /LENGTH=287 /DNA_ID=CAMNT_0014346981 /DNA_START=19 /DNA_END=882 /DNA_ORIENTATION=+
MLSKIATGAAILGACLSTADASVTGAPLRLRGGDRKYHIAGNWKLNPATIDEAKTLASAVVKSTKDCKRDMETTVCCPYPFLAAVADVCKGTKVSVGAEDVFTEDKGAFTGGVSTSMLKSVGVKYVLVGHSERRHGNIAAETNEVINLKVKKVLEAGLLPVLCVGETKDQYEAGKCTEVCAEQLEKGLAGISKDDMAKITIAYEPVWAIGTGLVATPEAAQEVHANIRSWLEKAYDKATADKVCIQYGGSVAPDNVDKLMACPDIDGALVGGAALIAEKFDRIIKFE